MTVMVGAGILWDGDACRVYVRLRDDSACAVDFPHGSRGPVCVGSTAPHIREETVYEGSDAAQARAALVKVTRSMGKEIRGR